MDLKLTVDPVPDHIYFILGVDEDVAAVQFKRIVDHFLQKIHDRGIVDQTAARTAARGFKKNDIQIVQIDFRFFRQTVSQELSDLGGMVQPIKPGQNERSDEK